MVLYDTRRAQSDILVEGDFESITDTPSPLPPQHDASPPKGTSLVSHV